jgi:hypothetical protein
MEVEDEIALLEEQLATAHADIERLQGQLSEAHARVAAHESENADMKRQLSAAQQTLAEREETLAAHSLELEGLRAALSEHEAQVKAAAERYRGLLLTSEPELPSELVFGDSIEAIEEAAAQARQTVARVRQHLEQQAQTIRVPAGAPPRWEPDLSDLSPSEKIRQGLEQR